MLSPSKSALYIFTILCCIVASNNPTNTMGYIFDDNRILTPNHDYIETIKRLVSEHGCIMIQNISDQLTTDDWLTFVSQFGEPIALPNGFGFNTSSAQSYITNITNIDHLTGEIKTNYSTAEYFHNDGDFWQQNYIYTFLFGDIIPEIGGNTNFIDLRLAHKYLYNSEREMYDLIKDKRVVIDVNDIPDFKDSPFLDEFNRVNDIAYHKMMDRHVITNESVLYYAHKNALIEGFNKTRSNEIMYRIDELLANNEEIGYSHAWAPRELMIWDNTAVTHRGAGGYQNKPRRMCRIQARMNGYCALEVQS